MIVTLRKGRRAVRVRCNPEMTHEEANQAFYTALETKAGKGQTVYMGPFLMLGDGTGQLLGMLELLVRGSDSGWAPRPGTPHIHIGFIGVNNLNQRRQGRGTKMMQLLTAVADELGFDMNLDVEPKPTRDEKKPPMNVSQLKAFYKKHGFVVTKGRRMERICKGGR